MENLREEKSKNLNVTEQLSNSKPEKDNGAFEDTNYASFWVRLQAQLIDWQIFLLIINLLLYLIFSGQSGLDIILPRLAIILYLNFFVISFISYLYQIIMVNKFGGTVGKLISGIRVIFENGKFLNFKQSIFRYLVGYFVSGLLFGLGFLWIFRDLKNQGWHDQISATFVVYYNRNLRFIGTLVLIIIIGLNGLLIYKTVQSIRANTLLQSEIELFIEGFDKILENQDFPATIEPQEPPLII